MQSVCENWMEEFVEHAMECASTTDTNRQSELKKESPENFAAFTHMKNSETRKFRRPLLNLEEKCIVGNDQCPKTSRKANDALTNHKWDGAWIVHPKRCQETMQKSNQKSGNANDGNGRQSNDGKWKPQLAQKEKMCYV